MNTVARVVLLFWFSASAASSARTSSPARNGSSVFAMYPMYSASCRPRRRTVSGSGKKRRQRTDLVHIATTVVAITKNTAIGSAWASTAATSRTSTTYNRSSTAIRLTATPTRARGSLITRPCWPCCPGSTSSGARDLIDHHAAIAIRHIEPIADHSIELCQPSGRVVCPFEAADDDEADTVFP